MTRLVLLVLCVVAGAARADDGVRLVEARKIWDQAPHNAFTDLIRFKDRWFCVFREGQGHVSPDGALRVITSPDGAKWESAALLASPTSDLRDAKITVTPAGQLMLSGAEALHDKSNETHQSLAWFSDDGRTWSQRYEIGDPNFWLWRVTWHQQKAFGIGYGCGKDRSIRLYTSDDGRKFSTLVERLFDVGYPNETSLVFEGDKCLCLLRRDGNPNKGLLGSAQPPYTQWEWKELNLRIGGPHMIRIPDGRYLAAVRLYDAPVRTALCWLDPQTARLTECLKLPSGGDTSYAGLVWHDDLLWISYYASHEGKTSIYLAKVKVAPAGNEGAAQAIAAAGGADKLLRLFRMKEKFNFGETLDPKGTARESVVEPPGAWWVGNSERGEEPAKYVVWAWTLGALVDPKSKLEPIADLNDNDAALAGIRVSGSVNPPMEIYFAKNDHRLSRVDWRGDIYRFSDWREHDSARYPAKCVIFKKASGKPWFYHEIVEIERLHKLPAGLKRPK